MALVEVNNISHSFGDKILYKNSSFELFKGEHMGLVGQNGTGKTTLLSSINGEIIPDKGEIRIQKNIKVGYLDQHVRVNKTITVFDYLKTAFEWLYEVNDKLEKIYLNISQDTDEKTLEKASEYQYTLESNGFYEIEITILKVADGLGVTAIGINNNLNELSGGQREKVILSKLLLENPDLLLMDEPTNFLDKEHIEWLIGFLQGFKGAFIVISHDYDFLDKITNCICDIEFAKIEKYHGSFSKYVELKARKRENYSNEYAAQQREIKKLEDYIAKNKVRASTAAMAKSRQKQLDRIDRLDAPETTAKPRFRFESLPISAEPALKIKNLEIGYYYPLLPKINLEISSGQKVIISGFNGIGKSTLVKTLLNIIPAISGDFKFSQTVKPAYFEQELVWDDDNSNAVSIVSDRFPSLSEKQVRKYLSQCGVKAKNVLQPVLTLSGGEQAKIKLCLLMLTKSNMLILDEPTNHLDVDTKEALKKELIKWEGSIILVTHEEAFYKDLADKVIKIGE